MKGKFTIQHLKEGCLVTVWEGENEIVTRGFSHILNANFDKLFPGCVFWPSSFDPGESEFTNPELGEPYDVMVNVKFQTPEGFEPNEMGVLS